MMIRYIKRSELDIEKYDLCIENSKNSRIYAFSWYLDIVADNWDVLILNDYEAVMPLPWRSKYFIKFIYPPCWTQQLGVFSDKEIDKELVDVFIKSIPKRFKKITLNLNSENNILKEKVIIKTNYILPLNKPYGELFKNYKSVRRRYKTRFNKEDLDLFKVATSQEIIKLFVLQKKSSVDLKKSDYDRLEQLISYLTSINSVDIIIVKNKGGVLLGGAFFIKDSKRITYLFSSVSPEGRDKKVMTYIIDSVIKEYADSNFILDFEGSMIPGIAFFFKSFGSQEEMYFNFQKRLIF
ncbi:MAG: hypothetical protein COA67_02005 [Lutibacter sp.]|nr:MAG: hypothetical protein COA67_02005 [Lutibacter sp.]